MTTAFQRNSAHSRSGIQTRLRRMMARFGPGLRILVFILLSLVLWVVISRGVYLAYHLLLPAAPPPAQVAAPPPAQSGEDLVARFFDWLTLPASGGDQRGWFFLVLPVAMLIAGLFVWPSDEEEPGTAPIRTATSSDVLSAPRQFLGRRMLLADITLDTSQATHLWISGGLLIDFTAVGEQRNSIAAGQVLALVGTMRQSAVNGAGADARGHEASSSAYVFEVEGFAIQAGSPAPAGS
jgi:hypothetical protein